MAKETVNIELPLPPRSAPRPELKEQREEVMLTLASGKTLSGDLLEYSPTSPTLLFKVRGDSDASRIAIEDIKTLQLMNSRQLVLDEEYLKDQQEAVTLPEERQDFMLLLTDGKEMTGETLGQVTDFHGLHLFITQAFLNYRHLFVPHTALKSQRIGPLIGEALIESRAVTKDDVEEGLKQQESLRNRRLGEYLTSEAIVTSEDLEQALKRQAATPNIRLGEALIQEGLISENQLEQALDAQKSNRRKPLGEILVDMGIISTEEIKKTLASKLGIPYVNLRKFNVEQNVLELVPQKIAQRHSIMPLCVHDAKLIVAIENPMNRAPLEDLRFHTKMFVEPVMASPEDIDWALNHNYGVKIDMLAAELDTDEPEEEHYAQEVSDSDNTLVKLVNKMIIDAYKQGVSDIHIEPYPGKRKTLIRFRKDGTLQPYVELPPNYRSALVSRLKIMCDLDISERRKPQDGKINFSRFGPAKIELRVATIPTAGGVEDVVLRILANGEPIPLDQALLSPSNLKNIKELVSKPYGLFLVCGPTGSGKTTTLHSILGHINEPNRKIWTAEDPVEITQAGLRQLQVNPKIGLTFAKAMRAFLRADPDVIMVGEMRDEETTRTAIEASLTGHLVLSTLHTNSAPESVVRLLDMGMDPFNFSDALLGILAQRLAKRLCPLCKEEYEASEEEVEDLFQEFSADLQNADITPEQRQVLRQQVVGDWLEHYGRDDKLLLFRAHGCEECENSGYDGRIALHELLVASGEIKKLIRERATVPEILLTAYSEGMRTLKQDGIDKILQGHTDLTQVRAVCIK